MFALVDCNNFYVSCERTFRPELRLRPVVVLSNNDGCIIARSEEAKALGIKMGTPEFNRRAEIMKTDMGYKCIVTNIVQLTKQEKLFKLRIIDPANFMFYEVW